MERRKSLLDNLSMDQLMRINRMIEDVDSYVKCAISRKREEGCPIQSKFNKTSKIKVTYTENVTLSTVIDWAKANRPQAEGVSFILIKEKSDDPKYALKLYLLYAVNGEPLLDGSGMVEMVYTKRIDDSLWENFGNGNVIKFE